MSNLLAIYRGLGTLQSLAIFAISVTVIRLTVLYFFTIRYPANLPRVREKANATRISLKTRMAYYTDCKSLFKEAYDNFSSKGKTCLLPGIGFRDEIIIPLSSLRWLTSQSDKILSVYDAFIEVDQVKYVLGHERYIGDQWTSIIFRKEMSPALEVIAHAFKDELKYAFDSWFGTDTEEWNEIEVLQSMKMIVAQGSSRFTVGLPLCRDKKYLHHSSASADFFVFTAGAIGILPKLLRPIFGQLFAIPLSYHAYKTRQALSPEIERRLSLLQTPKDSPTEPFDQLQLILRYAQTSCPSELNLHDLSNRLAVANLGSYHQTSIAITNILLNILASDAEYDTIALLRQEFETVLAAHDNEWTKASVAQMVIADSICRESLRINSFGGRSVMRIVMVDGLKTEDGILLPKGSMVSVLAYPSQCDGNIFPNAFKFDPFRFSRPREQSAAESQPNQAFVATGPTFLPFGHGRHACPGRFLLDFELKMILAHVFLDFDVAFPEAYRGRRPESRWLAEAIVPPGDARIRVRRRKGGGLV